MVFGTQLDANIHGNGTPHEPTLARRERLRQYSEG
jgi:hypothetical protein